MKVLGFDYGLARIGVALVTTEVGIASPLCTIQQRDKKHRWAAVSALIAEWNPERLVVGLPQYHNGENSEFSDQAKRFARQLQGRYNLPVDLVTEQLTSLEAEQRLRETRRSGRKRKIQKAEIDQLAATIILETWLEQHPS